MSDISKTLELKLSSGEILSVALREESKDRLNKRIESIKDTMKQKDRALFTLFPLTKDGKSELQIALEAQNEVVKQDLLNDIKILNMARANLNDLIEKELKEGSLEKNRTWILNNIDSIAASIHHRQSSDSEFKITSLNKLIKGI